MNEPTHLDLFAGILGFSIAFESEGFRTVGIVECHPVKNIVNSFWRSDLPNLGDVRDTERIAEFCRTHGPIDVITGGVPCQPASALGQQRGTSDERWLWPATIALVGAVRPRYAVFENPPAIIDLERGGAWNGIVSGSYQDWSKSGMICCGMYFPLERLVQGIEGKGNSSLLPTPTSSPDQRSPEAIEKYESEGGHASSTTFRAVRTKLLPTPTTTRMGVDLTLLEPTDQRTAPNKLGQAIGRQMLPTPTTRDYKDSPGMATETEDRNRTDQLPRRIFADELIAKTGGMKLTPEFQSWLMGFPVDWLKPLRSVPVTLLSRMLSGRLPARSTSNSKPKPNDERKCE